MKLGYVYWVRAKSHTNIFEEGYVGVTNNFDARMKKHSSLKSGSHHLASAINKYGWSNLIKSVIVIGNEEYCYEVEKALRGGKEIGWNIVEGGGKPPLHTKETKQRSDKWRTSLFGEKPNPMHNADSIAKLSGVNHWTAKNPGRYAGKSNPFFGRVHSDKTRKAISKAKKGSCEGDKNPAYDSTIRHFEHAEHGKFIGTAFDLRTLYSLRQGNMSSVLNGSRKSIGGWRYIGVAENP